MDFETFPPYLPAIVTGAFTALAATITVRGILAMRGEPIIHKQKQAIELATARLVFLEAHDKVSGTVDLKAAADNVRSDLESLRLYYTWREAKRRGFLEPRKNYSRVSYWLSTLMTWFFCVIYMLSAYVVVDTLSRTPTSVEKSTTFIALTIFTLFGGAYFLDSARIERYRPDKPIISSV